MRDAIRTMPKAMRAALWLVYVEGVASGEAAELLGLNANTTKSSLARGRRLLRERLGPPFHEDERVLVWKLRPE